MFFERNGGDGAVAGADEGVGGEAEDLLLNFLAGKVEVFAGATNGASEDGIANDGDVGGVLGPGADDEGGAVLGVAGGVAEGDAQAAEVDEVVGAGALIDGSVFGTGVEFDLGEAFADGGEGGDVIGVGVGDEEVFELELVFREECEDGGGVPAGVEEGGFAGDFVPDEVAVDGVAALGGGDLAEFAPGGEVDGGREPTAGDGFEFGRVETEQGGKFGEVGGPGGFAGGF